MMLYCDLHFQSIKDSRGCPWCQLEQKEEELNQITVEHERELESWKNGSEAQAEEIKRLKEGLRKVWVQVLEPAHLYKIAMKMQKIAGDALGI